MKEQLEQQKQQLENSIFMEQMQDYIDWNKYNEMQNELKEVNNQLEELK